MGLIEILFVLCVLASVGLAVYGVYGLAAGPRGEGGEAVSERLSTLMGEEDGTSALRLERPGRARASRWPWLDALVQRIEPWRRLDVFVKDAGKKVTATELAGISVVLLAVGVVAVGVLGLPLPVLLVLTLLAALPWWQVARLRAERIARFEEQFPDALDLMSRAMRAGHSFASAVRLCGDEIPQPLGRELRQFAEELNYGVSFSEAVNDLARRVPVREVAYFVVAILVQRESGGNLIEILDKIGALVRQRIHLAGEIRAITAQGRLSARIMLALPFVFCTLIYQIQPELISFLWIDPMGRILAWTALLMLVMGALVVRRIIDIRL